MTDTLGKYELLQKLGEGATSTVYLGRDPFARRDVAIKIATPAVLNDPRKGKLYTNLFLNEASLVGKLNHPHIVQIYDAVVTDTQCYIVMEYVDGHTLERHTTPDALLPPEQVVEIIFKCTRALDFAYRLGITHRDIKPANILLKGKTDIKLTDFGTAIIGRQTERTLVNGIGSPAYMSPEQVQEADLDHRTDIYSLGVVMFQLLTGRLPFEGDSNYKTIYQIIHDPTPLPSALRPGLPAALDAIVSRAMARDRTARYQSWEAFAQDLSQAVRKRHLNSPRVDFSETEKFDTLRAMPFFSAFSDVELWEVLRFSQWDHVPPGTVVMRDGEPGEFFCFLAEGTLKVSKAGKLLTVLDNGACFGEMAVISRHSPLRGADVIALTAASLVTVRGEALAQASTDCRMHFYQSFVEVLASRLALANQRLATH